MSDVLASIRDALEGRAETQTWPTILAAARDEIVRLRGHECFGADITAKRISDE